MQTRKLIKASALALILSACGNGKEMVTPAADMPINLADQNMMSTLWMQHSHEVKILQKQQYKNAERLLLENIESYHGDKRFAIIVDIDETVLDNSPYEARMIKNATEYTTESWDKWVKEAQAELVPGARDFLKMAEENGVEVFYISNRDAVHMDPTMENMRIHDLPFVDESHILLKMDEGNKTERRERVKNDFKVMLVVGDQIRDFMEETENFSADVPNVEGLMDSVQKAFVILPNPMYGGFEKALYRGQTGLSAKQKDQLRRQALMTQRKK